MASLSISSKLAATLVAPSPPLRAPSCNTTNNYSLLQTKLCFNGNKVNFRQNLWKICAYDFEAIFDRPLILYLVTPVRLAAGFLAPMAEGRGVSPAGAGEGVEPASHSRACELRASGFATWLKGKTNVFYKFIRNLLYSCSPFDLNALKTYHVNFFLRFAQPLSESSQEWPRLSMSCVLSGVQKKTSEA